MLKLYYNLQYTTKNSFRLCHKHFGTAYGLGSQFLLFYLDFKYLSNLNLQQKLFKVHLIMCFMKQELLLGNCG